MNKFTACFWPFQKTIDLDLKRLFGVETVGIDFKIVQKT